MEHHDFVDGRIQVRPIAGRKAAFHRCQPSSLQLLPNLVFPELVVLPKPQISNLLQSGDPQVTDGLTNAIMIAGASRTKRCF